MKKFKITIDKKYTIWKRETYTVMADSLEEAKDKLLNYEYYPSDINNNGSYILKESLEPITKKENFAMANCDILIPDDNDLNNINDEYNVEEFVDELCMEI